MRLGVWTPLPHTIRAEPAMAAAIAELTTPGGASRIDASFQFAVDTVRWAETQGFETTLIAERLLGPDLEAWILSAALAAHTTKIELMTAVHPGIVTPQVVAKMGASLDRISGGRFAVNVVNGWFQKEFEMFSNGGSLEESDRRYRRMDEFVRVIKGLWTEERFSLQGEFYNVENGTLPTKPIQQPHPPIYAASRSAAGKDTIARDGTWWFVAYEPNFREFERNLKGVAHDIAEMTARSRSYGRDIRYAMAAHVICADTIDAAEAEAAALEVEGRENRIVMVAARHLGTGFVGTPELIAERLRRYEEVGVECVMLHFHPMRAGLENFVRRVMPLLQRSLVHV